MRRRGFIAGLGAVAASPLAARAQQSAVPVIGCLIPTLPDAIALEMGAFRQGLKEAGYVEGRNVAVEYRWAGGRFDRFPAMAAELVRRPVDVIFAVSPPAVMAVKALTTTIPVVFSIGEDPIKEGLVANFNRPGGNVTGYSNFHNLLSPKKLGLLRDTFAKATTFGLLVNPFNPNAEPDAKEARTAALSLGLEIPPGVLAIADSVLE
jgi:putative tryptophan/tyrosine transport system substrate-binding protein